MKTPDNVLEDRIEIRYSRKKLVLLFLVALVFVAGGIQMAADATLDHMPSILKFRILGVSTTAIFGWAGIILFGFCAVVSFVKFWSNKPGLIITKTGILFNSDKEFLWSDVSGLGVYEVFGNKMVTLLVHDLERFIAGYKKASQRFLMKQNMGLCGAPMAIPASGLKISFDELIEHVL